MKDVLIIGSEGKLGSGLMRTLEIRARGTSRKTNLLPHQIYFDLLNQDSIQNLKKISDFRFAIIVAAISDPDQCYKNQQLSSYINVDSTISVLKLLKEIQIKPIFISTEMVFNGNGKLYSEIDKPEPILIYGKQKLEVESFILGNFDDFMIFRLSKIYSSKNNDNSILNSFFHDIFNNKKVSYAKDQYFSPTLQGDFELSILKSIEKDLSGVFHISAGSRISRWGLFELFAEAIGNFGKARPCLLSDLKFLETRPKDLSLNGEKLSKAIDFEFISPKMGIDRWIDENLSTSKYN